MKKSLLGAAMLALALSPIGAHTAELKVIAGGGMTNPLNELRPKFEAATGHKVTIVFAATPVLIKLATDTPIDVAVVPVDVFKNADAKAKFAAGPTIDIARVGYGVAVKAGAPKPDISTADGLKRALLNAQSITLLPESAAGAYVLSVFDRLGIAAEMKAKTKSQTTTGAIAQAVATGEAELGVFLTNVLIAPGVELAGPFPGDLQNDLVFTAGVAADSKEAAAAKAFITYLQTPEAMAVIKARGMTPG
jgi:molybdate transport system substrate-binding protein